MIVRARTCARVFALAVAACGAPAPIAPTVPAPREAPPAPLPLPRAIASNLACARKIEVDATHVYWMDGGGAISRTAKSGGAVEKVVSPPVRKRLDTVETEFVLDGDAVVWSEVTWDPSVEKDSVEARVLRAPKSGGAPAVLAKTEPTNLFRVAVDGAWVYWEQSTPNGGALVRVPKSGGAVATVVDEPSWRWTLSRGALYRTNREGAVVRQSPSGGPPTFVLAAANIVSQMVVDESRIYWATVREPHVLSSALHDRFFGDPEKIADVDSFFEALVQDATHLYWLESIPFGQVEWTSTRLQRAPKMGGPVETLGDDFAGPCMDLAVDADAVYVACCGTDGKDPHDGSVVARAKTPR